LLGFFAIIAAAMALIGFAVVNELDDIGPTLSSGIDDVEDWLVDDSPFDVTRTDIDEFRDSIGERASSSLRDSGGSIVTGAVLAAEAILSVVLGLILSFFALKDGDRFLAFVRTQVPDDRVDLVSRIGQRAWRTLGGYLRGAATLGVVEGTIIGVTLWLVGADLAVPMAVLTFIAAFVPFVGAIVAALVAVLVALGTAGLVPALIVAGVALVVQQLDNDLLAPVVYGRALDLHPVVVLLGITAGGALFGIAGSIMAVPVVAVAWGAVAEARLPDEEIA
jgi:predicted PurR-regulated permease PerM